MWNLKRHWVRYSGIVLVAYSVLYEAIKIGGDIDFVVGVFTNPGWVKTLSEFLFNPPGWLPIVVFILGTIALIWDRRLKMPRSPVSNRKPSIQPPDDKPLTADERSFRIALKQFALTYPKQLLEDLARVRSVLIAKIKADGDKNYSHALHQAMHSAFSNEPQSFTALRSAASKDTDHIDPLEVQRLLVQFVEEYEWLQKLTANLNLIAAQDLEGMDETRRWLEGDKEAVVELRRIAVWPEANIIKDILNSQSMASQRQWNVPYRVNF